MGVPVTQFMRRELAELTADWRGYRAQGWGSYVRERPAKGLRRSILISGWLALHSFEAVAITVYGLPWGPYGAPVSTILWLVITALAGLAYVHFVFSDPGFLTPDALQMLADVELGRGAINVRGTAEVRGEIVLRVEDCRELAAPGTSAAPDGAMAPAEEGPAAGAVECDERGASPPAAEAAIGTEEIELAPVLSREASAVSSATTGSEDEDAVGAEEKEAEVKAEPGREAPSVGGGNEGGDAGGGVGGGASGDSGLGMGLTRVVEDEEVRRDADGELLSKERAFWEDR